MRILVDALIAGLLVADITVATYGLLPHAFAFLVGGQVSGPTAQELLRERLTTMVQRYLESSDRPALVRSFCGEVDGLARPWPGEVASLYIAVCA